MLLSILQDLLYAKIHSKCLSRMGLGRKASIAKLGEYGLFSITLIDLLCVATSVLIKMLWSDRQLCEIPGTISLRKHLKSIFPFPVHGRWRSIKTKIFTITILFALNIPVHFIVRLRDSAVLWVRLSTRLCAREQGNVGITFWDIFKTTNLEYHVH